MVKLWFCSSVATLEAHKSERGVETNCHTQNEYNKSAFAVISDHAHGRHFPTYQQIYALAAQN